MSAKVIKLSPWHSYTLHRGKFILTDSTNQRVPFNTVEGVYAVAQKEVMDILSIHSNSNLLDLLLEDCNWNPQESLVLVYAGSSHYVEVQRSLFNNEIERVGILGVGRGIDVAVLNAVTNVVISRFSESSTFISTFGAELYSDIANRLKKLEMKENKRHG